MPILYPSTVERIRFYANFVVSAVALAVTWACILAIGVGLNWLINWVLGRLMAPEVVERYSGQIALIFILFLGLAATLTSFKDVIALTVAGLRGSADYSADNAVGETRDAEQESPSD